jgi:hypothetical protein
MQKTPLKSDPRRTFKSTMLTSSLFLTSATLILLLHLKYNLFEYLILLSSANEIFTFALSGDYKHSFFNEGANFCDMCKDGCGNVFLADNNNDRICLLTPNGNYARDVLTSSDGISK